MIRMIYAELDVSQLHTALVHIVIKSVVWTATPLSAVIRVTRLGA